MAERDWNNRINLPFTLSSSTPSWGDFHHHATRPSTSLLNKTVASAVNYLWENHNNSNSSPCDQEDISITASGHSSLTVDESSHRFVAEPSLSFNNIIRESAAASNSQYLWTQLLSGVGEGQEMPDQMNDEVGENLLNALSLKSFSGGMFEPSACSDYLKKLDTCRHNEWAENNGDHFPNSNTNSSFTNCYNKLSFNNNVGYFGDSTMIESDEHQRSLIKLSSSNPVNSWSIAPPDQSQIHHLDPRLRNNIPSINQNLEYQQELFDMGRSVGNSSFDGASYNSFNHKQPENYHREEIDRDGSSQTNLFPKSYFNNPENGARSVGGNWRPRESSMHYQNGFSPSAIDPFSHSRSPYLTSKPLLKSLSLLDSKKLHQGHLSKPLINKSNRRGQGASNEAKKRKSDDNSQSSGSLKKPKHENGSSNPSSTASSSAKATNSQTPKVKIAAEKISALQQIVSPYGKTDTASVLQEAIGFIKCLQEQVQLHSNPYLKSSVNYKLQGAWGSLDMKFDKGDQKNKEFDLKSKGLCLVPTSSIPPVFKDNSGPDYWPTYRGYLYR